MNILNRVTPTQYCMSSYYCIATFCCDVKGFLVSHVELQVEHVLKAAGLHGEEVGGRNLSPAPPPSHTHTATSVTPPPSVIELFNFMHSILVHNVECSMYIQWDPVNMEFQIVYIIWSIK